MGLGGLQMKNKRWRLGKTGDDTRMILDGEGRYVCSIQIHQIPRHQGDYDERRRLKNVPLLLAAPELYEALHALVEDPKFDVAIGGNPYAVQKMLAAAQAALLKAEGK